jgi:hypothetical protein
LPVAAACGVNCSGCQRDAMPAFQTLSCAPAPPPSPPCPSSCSDLSQQGLRISQLPDLAPSRREGWEEHAPLLASLAPPQLCFQRLEVLRLNENAVGGTLPASWGDLPRLQTLDLSSNALQGARLALRRW